MDLTGQTPPFFISIQDQEEFYLCDMKTVDIYGDKNKDSVKHLMFWRIRLGFSPIRRFLKTG